MGFKRSVLIGMIALVCLPAYHGSARSDLQNKVSAREMFNTYFTQKGFVTGKIGIPELKTEVVLKENRFFRKEENVEDVCERITEIREEFGLPNPDSECVLGYGWCGFLHADYGEEKAYGYIVLIKKGLNDVSRVYTVGHECGHFLWYISQQEMIYQKFKKPDLVRAQISSNCDFAVLCGWAAVEIAGYNLSDCIIIDIENPEKQERADYLKKLVKEHLSSLSTH
ncbi:MAG: hypothetical protein J7L72_09415 [Candidatus Aminicenantes bacterium]|nr:hypothetical protein [Candidatus Aminicenantes bacterium]